MEGVSLLTIVDLDLDFSLLINSAITEGVLANLIRVSLVLSLVMIDEKFVLAIKVPVLSSSC